MLIKITQYIKRSFLVLFSLSLLISCAVNPVTGRKELMLINERQEIELGKSSAPSLKWEFGGEYHDPELKSYLGMIVDQLWQNSERPHLPMQFYIQNTSVPNAFALPGYVAITRGLLSEMENEAQFAAVMGHEVGHVMARHTAQRLSRMQLQQIGLAVGSAALEGIDGSDTLLKIGAVGSSLLLLKFDRSQEIQSDRLGARYMADLGYDPNEALSAHEVLEKSVGNYLKRLGKARGEDNLISNLLSTHPRASVRLGEIKEMINELPPYKVKNDGKFGKRFQKTTKKLREANKIYHIYDRAEVLYNEKKYSEAENKLNDAIEKDNSQAPFYNLLGLIKLHQKKYEEAARSYKKALSIDPVYHPSLYGMGLVSFLQERYKPAISRFKKSLKLFPGHAPTHFVLGKSHYMLKEYSDAIPYLKNFAGAAPGHPEIHGLLGISYDNRKEIKQAAIEYMNQLKVAPDTELGRHAKKRLKELGVLQ
jgi:predicted Zn-dependent protease